jgi:predicted nucleotidyltransferase
MNIKITKEQHLRLLERTSIKVPIGSHLYGTNTEKSDTDILCIYEPFDNWKLLESYPNYHQFQYDCEETNRDYIYTTFGQFWKNQRSGDSTINSDIIMFTNAITESDESKLNYCRTFKVIKSFIGFAKRDIKQSLNDNTGKKLFHATRGLYCAQSLLEGDLPDVYNVKVCFEEPWSYNYLVEFEKSLREVCNIMFEKKKLENYFVRETNDDLLNLLLSSNNIREFKY